MPTAGPPDSQGREAPGRANGVLSNVLSPLERTLPRPGEGRGEDEPGPELALGENRPRRRGHRGSGAPTPAPKPSKEEVGWRRVVRNFTPSWFAVNMGTGIVSILIHNLPYNAAWLQYISYAFFCLNIVLFLVFLTITLVRYTLYPEIWTVMINHPGQSLFLGAFPMGLATIINMAVFVCADWGDGWIHLAWGLWWFDVAVSVACAILMPFVVMHRHKVELHQTTAALLLPVVPAVVAAASGGIVAEVLPSRHAAVTTLVTSYILWGIGESFAMVILAMYFHRLLLHSLPPRELIVSVFLPVGPLGQGGFGIQQLGRVALQLLPETRAFGPAGASPDAVHGGEVLYYLGVFLAFVMWGAGLGWLIIAAASIITTTHFPFNMGWWGFTFPLGVFTTCTGLMAKELSSTFFEIVTMIFSLAVVLLWCVVAAGTVLQALSGDIFFAPCLKDLRPKAQQPLGAGKAV